MVIGDTPKDIECAKHNNFISVAVATGRYSVEELAKHQPDFVLTDLSDHDNVYNILMGLSSSM